MEIYIFEICFFKSVKTVKNFKIEQKNPLFRFLIFIKLILVIRLCMLFSITDST